MAVVWATVETRSEGSLNPGSQDYPAQLSEKQWGCFFKQWNKLCARMYKNSAYLPVWYISVRVKVILSFALLV